MAQASSFWSDAVWASVAAELRGHLEQGFHGLLTEDVVRFATVKALVAAGVEAALLQFEAPHPVLKGSRVDLAVGRPRPVALIELKFPREPKQMNAPRTMSLGEVLKDFYRLAAWPGEVDRIFVYVESDQLRRYMSGIARRHGIDLDTGTVTLTPAVVAELPPTALASIGTDLVRHHVTATRLAVLPVHGALRLAVYRVDPLAHAQSAASPAAVSAIDVPPPSHSRPTREGARREILDAVRAVLTRSGGSTFTPLDIIAEMTRRGTGYAESTIRTMIVSHLCRNAPDHAATTYDDLERVGRGLYRLATH